MESSNIFEDLGLNYSGEIYTNKEKFQTFAEEVYAKAKELEKILNDGPSTSQIEDKAKRDYNNDQSHQAAITDLFGDTFSAILQSAENLPLPQVYGLIKELESLTKQISDTMFTRATTESIAADAPLHNKKLTQMLHKRLREAWDSVRTAGKLLFKLDTKKIDSKSGNYSASMTDVNAYYLNGEEEPYFNPSVVARKLGIHYPGITLMDILEYCEDNPDHVEIRRVRL